MESLVLTLVTAQLRRVHGFAQHFDSQVARLLERAVLLVVLLEQALGARVVGARTSRLPPAIVSRGVAQIQLELTLRVPTGVDERDAKGPQTTVLCVALLQIAQPPHQLLTRNVFVVGQQVPLGNLPCEVDQDVGIGCHAGHSADHVAGESVSLSEREMTGERDTDSLIT